VIPIRKEDFNKIFPELEKIYVHSGKTTKLWQSTVGKTYIIADVEAKIKQYWKYGYVSP
jgi:hypothetical protein